MLLQGGFGNERAGLSALRCVCEFPASSFREVVDDPGGKVRISSPKAMLLSLTYNLWLIILSTPAVSVALDHAL